MENRELPLCPLNDDVYIGAFVIFGDPELTTAAAQALLERAPEYDYQIVNNDLDAAYDQLRSVYVHAAQRA